MYCSFINEQYMSDGYELVECQIDEQHKFWELKKLFS